MITAECPTCAGAGSLPCEHCPTLLDCIVGEHASAGWEDTGTRRCPICLGTGATLREPEPAAAYSDRRNGHPETERTPLQGPKRGASQVVVLGIRPPQTALPAKSEFAMNKATRGVRHAKGGTRKTGSDLRVSSPARSRMTVFRTARLTGSTIADAAVFIKWAGTSAVSTHEQRGRSIEGHAAAEAAAGDSIRVAADRHSRRPRIPVANRSLTDAPTRGPDAVRVGPSALVRTA